MTEQILIPGCETPLLASIDPGLTDGYIIRNLADGSLEAHRMPLDAETGYMDTEAIKSLLRGYDRILLEHVPLRTQGPMNLTENCVWGQYQYLYGLFDGLGLPFETIRPQEWMEILNLPKRGKTPEKEWKWMLHDQAVQRFPTIKKITKDSAAAYLLYRVLTMTYREDLREQGVLDYGN